MLKKGYHAISRTYDDKKHVTLLTYLDTAGNPVTTTDELIPSGETSSYRSNPEGLAEFTLSRKDPAYVGEAKKVRKAEIARRDGELEIAADLSEELPELFDVLAKVKDKFGIGEEALSIGSTIYAVKPGDGSAREQAASCQKVLGGWANIAQEYSVELP